MSERTAGWATDDEAVTPQEQRRGRALDERLDEEASDRDASSFQGWTGALVDEDRPDTESELVSQISEPRDRDELTDETTDASVEDAGWDAAHEDEPAAEEAAVSVRDDAPGGTDDASDDYVLDDGGGST